VGEVLRCEHQRDPPNWRRLLQQWGWKKNQAEAEKLEASAAADEEPNAAESAEEPSEAANAANAEEAVDADVKHQTQMK